MISNIFNSKGIHVGTVTSAAILTRYLVRMGSKNWMVWDRQARAPARLGEMGRPAIDLTGTGTRNQRRVDQKSHCRWRTRAEGKTLDGAQGPEVRGRR